MKSFDEFCKKHELTRNLDYVKLAWNTKQAEVDELRKKVKDLELINFDSELHLDAAKEHIDELQKRIDEALEVLRNMKQHGVDEAVYILKGDQS